MLKLKKPLDTGKEVINEINFDFGKLRGRDLLECESSARAMGDSTASISFSMKYQILVAAKASGLKYDDLLDLPGDDYMKVLAQVNGFLFSGGSTEDERSNTSENS